MGPGFWVGQEGSAAEDGVSTSREESWNWVMIPGFCPSWVGGYSGAEREQLSSHRPGLESGGGGGKKGEEKGGVEKAACD